MKDIICFIALTFAFAESGKTVPFVTGLIIHFYNVIVNNDEQLVAFFNNAF